MAAYTYKARDESGKLVKGTMEAETKEALIDKLRKMGYMTTDVRESTGELKLESFFSKFQRVPAQDMIMFNVQLANMINAGITILSSLATLDRQSQNKVLKDAIGVIRRDVEAGDSFSEAVAKHPGIFSKLFMNMIRAGEASGKLDVVLTKYAQYYEYQTDLREKIKGALFYPSILLVSGILVTLFIVTFIIPEFVRIFTISGISLPVPTMILYNVGLGIKKFWYLGFLSLIGIIFAIRSYAKSDKGRLKFDRLRLDLPIIGPICRKSSISRFARTLGTLVTSGVPILESLGIVKEIVGNEVLARVIGNVRRSVEGGQSIAEPLKISQEFPMDIIQMISVGEESGSLDLMLEKISDFYNMSLGYTIKRLTTIIEPLFLAIMGLMVGFIMASILLPIFDMVRLLR